MCYNALKSEQKGTVMKLTVSHKITDKDREELLDGLRAYIGYALKMSLPDFPERGMQRHYLTKEDLAD